MWSSLRRTTKITSKGSAAQSLISTSLRTRLQRRWRQEGGERRHQGTILGLGWARLREISARRKPARGSATGDRPAGSARARTPRYDPVATGHHRDVRIAYSYDCVRRRWYSWCSTPLTQSPGADRGWSWGASLSLGPDEQQLRDPAAVPVAVWAVARLPCRVGSQSISLRRVMLPCRLQRDRNGGFHPLPRARRDVRSRRRCLDGIQERSCSQYISVMRKLTYYWNQDSIAA
jgi:hypothetical protein